MVRIDSITISHFATLGVSCHRQAWLRYATLCGMSTHEDAPLSRVVAANVRAECARRGWRQEDLATRLGVSRLTVGDRHRERTPWTLDETQKVANLFGVEIGDLLARPKGFEPLTF